MFVLMRHVTFDILFWILAAVSTFLFGFIVFEAKKLTINPLKYYVDCVVYVLISMYLCNLYFTAVITAEPVFPAFAICQNSAIGNIFPAKLNVVLMHVLLGCSSFAPINLMIVHIKTVLRTKNFVRKFYCEKAAMIIATFVSFCVGLFAMFISKIEDESYSLQFDEFIRQHYMTHRCVHVAFDYYGKIYYSLVIFFYIVFNLVVYAIPLYCLLLHFEHFSYQYTRERRFFRAITIPLIVFVLPSWTIVSVPICVLFLGSQIVPNSITYFTPYLTTLMYLGAIVQFICCACLMRWKLNKKTTIHPQVTFIKSNSCTSFQQTSMINRT